MAEEKVQIIFRGTSEYRDNLQRAALDRGIKVQDLIEEALRLYLNMPGDDPRRLAAAENYALNRLRAIAKLFREHPSQMEGVEQMLQMDRGTLAQLLMESNHRSNVA